MAWLKNIVPENIKKNVCIYLLQRYLGQFFEEKITREQLTLNLSDGRASVEKVRLDVQALNELSENLNWPLEFVDGYIESLHVHIPWMAVLAESSLVEVEGLRITLQPKQRQDSPTSMFESMWNSMSSSLRLAEECAKQDATNSQNSGQPYEGIENFAQTIESILTRVNVKFINTTIQLEHVPKDSSTGVGLIINIDLMQYTDEAGEDPVAEETTNITSQDSKKAYIIQSCTVKKIIIEGVLFSTLEFSSKARTFSRSVIMESFMDSCTNEKEDSFISAFEKNSLNEHEEKTSMKQTSIDSVHANSTDEYRHVILFGKISNSQEIRIKLKESENVIGPKISIDINLGSLILYLSPRQFHLMLELANGLASPDIQDTSNVISKNKCVPKPMTGMDYQRVEQELQQQLQPLSSFPSSGLQGRVWSGGPNEEVDVDEHFLPLKNAISGMYDSSLSGISCSMESSLNSSFASSVTETGYRQNRRLPNLESDPTAEISHLQIRISSLAIVLVHEDLLFRATDGDHILSLASVQQMQQSANDFFTKLGNYVPNAFGNKDFELGESVFNEACNLNHLRLIAAPVQIEVHEKTTSSAFSVTASLTVAKLIILECLYDPTNVISILSFSDSIIGSSNTGKPNFKLNVKHVEKFSKQMSGRRNGCPKTDIGITLSKCSLEFDITMVDRLTALLNPPTICINENSSHKCWKNYEAGPELESNIKTDCCLSLKVTSPLINWKLRFPIPDFRPLHDLSRTPWWKRNLRADYLSIVLSDAALQTDFQTTQLFQEIEVLSRGFHIYYYETENSQPLEIAKGGFEHSTMQDAQTKFSVKVYPKKPPGLDENCSYGQDLMTTSMFGVLVNQNSTPSPFSAKKVVHESDTPHPKSHTDDAEELIIPGDQQEIDEFRRSSCCRINIDICIPTISLHLKSKHIYELIYNRINNDLLLWEPSAPKQKPESYENSYQNYETKFSVPESFGTCKSGIQYESESESEDDSEISDSNIFYSTYDTKKKSNIKQNQDVNIQAGYQSSVIVSLKIEKGLAVLNPPARESGSNNVMPGQQGELLLNVENANIFVVSGYKGDDNLAYICVEVHSANLYHCEMMSIPNTIPPLKDIGTSVDKRLHQTIYKSEGGMLACSNNRGGNREMITVSIKIQAGHETHHVKTVQVAVGLNNATLKHKMWNAPNSWISHLLDFFDVNDYPISSYQAKDVITEMYLHLWDCAIDYRPLHLPLRTVLTIGNFSMSSHLSASANCSVLRFIFEECGLFLSEKAPPRNGVASSASVDLKRDYVNVIQLGLFELSLKTSDKKSGVNPQFDLRASNNILNIHTCADSCKRLMHLITYIANDGDLMDGSNTKSNSNNGNFEHKHDEELVHLQPMDISNLSKSQHEHVNDLIGEAMEETEEQKDEEDEENRLPDFEGAKIFFFPGEHQQSELESLSKPLPQVTCELGDIKFLLNRNSDTDDEFCIIENEAGLGIFPKNGQPEINWLTSDPVRVVENHFAVPIGKTDFLKSPKHYPTPVMRYTLCDMSVVWHMYGGNDFTVSNDSETQKKTVNFSESQLTDTVSFSNVNKNEVTFTTKLDKKKTNLHWMQKGGLNRNLNVHMELQLSKVRFQHEQYPENTKHASRQVLIISELEIRDRLKTSELNKFLYQYTSQSKPKQSNANMVMVKLLHIRPDPKLPRQECCLKISLLPLRLNIDQDALSFLIVFFRELSNDNINDVSEKLPSKQSTPSHQPPVMTVNSDNEYQIKKQAEKIVNENLIMLLEENPEEQEYFNSNSTNNVTDESPIYFRNVIFSPEVPIRLDYEAKRVDMSHGPIPGLCMGLIHLNCSELTLKRISYRHGLLGINKLVQYLLQEWRSDIKKNQIPSLFGGLGPLYAVVQLFQGIKDLFWLPIEQYQKDGRIVRGLQRGANSFTTSTAMAALELTSKLIHLIQITAETAYDMLSPGPSLRRIAKSKGKKKRYHRPQDIREGMTNAYMVVREGIGETAHSIVQVAAIEKEQKGYSGALGGVIRQIPSTIIKPLIIASEATNNVLGGMKSQLVPDARQEANQKWRCNKM